MNTDTACKAGTMMRFPVDRLLALKADAMELLAEESAVTAHVLAILAGLSPEAIQEAAKTSAFVDSMVAKLTGSVEVSPSILRSTIIRTILPGLDDYACDYKTCEKSYNESGLSAVQLKEAVGDSGREMRFLLHGSLHGWHVREAMMSSGIGVPKGFSQVYKGYLVKRGRAFENVIQLLRSVRRECWPKWELLWRFF